MTVKYAAPVIGVILALAIGDGAALAQSRGASGASRLLGTPNLFGRPIQPFQPDPVAQPVQTQPAPVLTPPPQVVSGQAVAVQPTYVQPPLVQVETVQPQTYIQPAPVQAVPVQQAPVFAAPRQALPFQTPSQGDMQVAQNTTRLPNPSPSASEAKPNRLFDEWKLGGSAHDISLGGHGKEGGGDAKFELLFVSPSFLKIILAPRPVIGIDANANGNTSDAYAGLSWNFRLFNEVFSRNDGIFVAFTEAAAVHDGALDTKDPHRKALGSRVLFREALDIGYQIDDQKSIALVVDHISNAKLARRNEGITNAGARVGFKF